MTSKYKHLKQCACLWLSFSALIVLSCICSKQAATAQPGESSGQKVLLAQDSPDEDGARLPPPPKIKHRGAGEGTDPQFQPPRIDGDSSASVPRRNGQGFAAQAGGGQGDSDMPGWRMRRRFGQGGADMPGRQWRGPGNPGGGNPVPGGNPGDDDMSGRQPRGGNLGADEMPQANVPGQNANGPWRRNPGGRFAGGFPSADGRQGFRGGAGRAPQGAPGAGQGGAFGNKPLDLTPLALNEEQKTQIKQMRAKTKLKVKDLHQSVIEKQANLRNLMFNPDASEAQIRAARSQLRKLQDQVDETNMNDLLSIRAMLTPEQRKRLPDCMPGRNATANGGGPGPLPAPGPPGFPGPGGVPAPAPPPGFAGGFNQQSNDVPLIRRKRGNDGGRRSLEAENDNAGAK